MVCFSTVHAELIGMPSPYGWQEQPYNNTTPNSRLPIVERNKFMDQLLPPLQDTPSQQLIELYRSETSSYL
ncbi:hypothetical protein E2562_032770 [Oryza meyeriana var. granulata]|uniref:Uncharacterized protein n=1 Tax=Oryza meyeriana var. granulata TaxID=110450 RepID=A0A6G1F0R2_9ORYZ|nr:hypothetical protein E2562_032770 [Oryza meyeriana var. granulata]